MPENSAANSASTKNCAEGIAVRRRGFAVVVVAGCLAFFLTSLMVSCNARDPSATTATSARTASAKETVAIVQDNIVDFSRFAHDKTHGSLPCLLCHQRESNSPRPALPGHTPCAGCHEQKFADSASPICTVCHSDVSSAALKAFPGMRSFGIRFDHAQHLRGQGLTCATCHKPRRNGVAISIPSSFEAHSTCFQCHTNRTSSEGKDISSCGTCHVAGRYVRASETAKAFQVSFSHTKHTSKGLNCAGCHSVRNGVALARQVTAPQAAQHHASPGAQSCITCHNGKRAFGGDDFTSCKRCHQSERFSWGKGQ